MFEIGCGGKMLDKTEIIVSQWQTCVEMANSVSQRRDTMNNIFVTLNLAIVTTVSIKRDINVLYMFVVGMLLCCIWILMLRNYRLLNAAKFNVINAIENELPFTPFKDEWEQLKNDNKYIEGTLLDGALPVIFIAIYFFSCVNILYIK